MTERLVVPITEPVLFVAKSALGTPVIPRFVVVAPVARKLVAKKFVVVALVPVALAKTKLPVSVVEAKVAPVPNTSAPLPVSSVSRATSSALVSIDVDPSLALNIVQSVLER